MRNDYREYSNRATAGDRDAECMAELILPTFDRAETTLPHRTARGANRTPSTTLRSCPQ